MRLLHITAHLGGGVGKVLSGLVAESARRRDGVQHVIACLERPEKRTFLERVQRWGGEVLLSPNASQLTEEVSKADIVQVEWWHHPLVAGWLCAGELPAMRMVVWSHVSGLYPPEIPPAFLSAPHRFLFTSPCSWEHPRVAALKPFLRERVGVVFSSGGFEGLPQFEKSSRRAGLRVGYVGTLNFAKLHPRILEFVGAVRLPGFRLTLVGDPTTGTQLLAEAKSERLESKIEFRGYQTNIAKELAQIDVLAYLLNPLHYGTTENALLEAMAMGVVPVVLNNPAERHLVSHMESGLVVERPADFADAMDWLAAHPHERARLSANASAMVRTRFAVARTADGLMTHYQSMLTEQKRCFDFRPIFGDEPADWFRSCQGEECWRFADGEVGGRPDSRGPAFLYEKTKGSVFHFRNVYSADPRLNRWAQQLDRAA